MEDSKIVELYWSRSQRAISETAEKYGSYCRSIALGILSNREDAEECVNDTYLGAWNSIPPHRPTVLKTFLGKITRRISLKMWRDRNRQRRGGGEVALALDELSECVPDRASVEGEVTAAELSEAMGRFVEALPETQRKIFLCRYWYLDPVKTIARDFGFSESKVKSMLHRTRAKLLAYLKKEELL